MKPLDIRVEPLLAPRLQFYSSRWRGLDFDDRGERRKPRRSGAFDASQVDGQFVAITPLGRPEPAGARSAMLLRT
jgi:hypothetical protein